MKAKEIKSVIAAIEKKAANTANPDHAAGLCVAAEMLVAALHKSELAAIERKTARRLKSLAI